MGYTRKVAFPVEKESHLISFLHFSFQRLHFIQEHFLKKGEDERKILENYWICVYVLSCACLADVL